MSKLLKQKGVNVTKSKAQARIDANRVIALYENMHTIEEIAQQFKVNRQVITNCLLAHGVKIRSRWEYPER